jgi:uncharacterized membrane protein
MKPLTMVAVAGAVVALSFAAAGGQGPEAREDLRKLRQDRRQLRRDNREIRQDRRELRQDRCELRRDVRPGR